MSTLESLVKPTRERGGSVASNRFSFQQDWSLYKLLSLEKTGNDYVLIFEHDEDLMILDSETNPQKINFYQVKTKSSGSWSVINLLKKTSETGLSILGKLYSNKVKYDNQTETLNFVSNASFSVPLKNGTLSTSKSKICVIECDDINFKKITNALKKEHSLIAEPLCELVFLNTETLALHDSGIHAIGRISTFLSERNNQKPYNSSLIYNSLIGEIKRRCNYEYNISDLDELRKHKSISRAQFRAMLKVIENSEDKRFEHFWPATSQRLTSENEDLKTIENIRRCGTEYDSNITNYADEVHNDLCRNITALIDKYKEDHPNGILNYKEFLEEVLQKFKMSEFNKLYSDAYKDEYIKAVTLSKYYE